MKQYIERMCDESKELSAQIEVINERATKLSVFINENPIFKTLTEQGQKMQKEQQVAMVEAVAALVAYRDIVDARIAHELSK